MGVMERFFGRRKHDDPESAPVVNTALQNPPSLQVLFAEPFQLDPAALTQTLQSYHPSLSGATFELDPGLTEKGTPLGLVGWGEHVVQVVGFDVPMPEQVLELCVQPAHYGAELKAAARAHKAHVLLYYGGLATDPLERYVALAVVAGVLATHGALVVLNEAGHTSFPAEALTASEGDMLEQLRTFPILALYCGFVKYDVEGVKGVWMRTYGGQVMGLPDLATLAEGHHRGQAIFELFSNIYNYLRSSGTRFAAGHTMQVGADLFLRLRSPTSEEYFLDSPGELFVAEMISADEINRPRPAPGR